LNPPTFTLEIAQSKIADFVERDDASFSDTQNLSRRTAGRKLFELCFNGK
jgi:hypothetical protein